jgi:chromosome partitioning protein
MWIASNLPVCGWACAPPPWRPIGRWDTDVDALTKPPKGTTHAVLDTPAGLHGGA